MKLAKNSDLDKYKYRGYDIVSDIRSQFSLSNDEWDNGYFCS